MTGRAAFIALASKFAQVSPWQALPTLSPAVKFVADPLPLSVELGAGKLTFSSDKANAASATTEFLVQRLPSADHAPQDADFVTYGFHKFTSQSTDSFTPNLGPGLWSVAIQYVCPSSGEEAGFSRYATFLMGLAVVEGGMDEGEDAAEGKKAA